MITKPTVLILGAGASSDLGFPLGRKLKDIILQNLENPKPQGWFWVLDQLDYRDPKMLGEFVTSLKGCNLYNIDEFLLRQPRYSELAKTCIALALIPLENTNNLTKSAPYIYLFNQLSKDAIKPDQFSNNNLSIITFNYDRSLEQFLINSLRYTYNIDDNYANMLLTSLEITHIYGQLAILSGTGRDSRVYDSSTDPVFVKRAADQILSINDLQNKNIELSNQIKKILDGNKHIYFLGFGYDDINLNILKFNQYKYISVKGTSFGLGEAFRNRIATKWNIELANPQFRILEFLQYTGLD